MRDNQDREKNLTQKEKLESPVVIDMSEDSSIDRDLQFLALKKELAEKNRKIESYRSELEQIQGELERLNEEYRTALREESEQQQALITQKQSFAEMASQKEELLQDLTKLQTNYEGMLGREERYLREIRQLKNQINTQKEALYRTYSYRLGYILIHSTKSLRNFFRLPKDLISLYIDNRRRKSKKKILKLNHQQYHSRTKSSIPLFHKALEESRIESGRKQVRIATIMDEFTAFCFAPEAETLQLTPTDFKGEIENFKPDFLFIESAWQGKEGLWKLQISQQGEALLKLIQYCRDNGIKTLFWNKEDPVHFGTFIETAKLVDVVFTTDIDCVQKYKEILQHNEVYLLPFAAQPKTHNPIECFERLDKFNFAGSYYLKYPVRQRDFATLTEVAIESKGLDIYDRNFDNDHPHYQFPERYHPLILGALPPEEIDSAYKGYEFGINMNTIKQSQTMFARRVFEMLASNTVVLSNYSRGMRLFFGDLVISSDNEQTLKNALEPLLADSFYRKKFKLEGVRKVLSEHTYAHRLEYILKKLKIEWEAPKISEKIAVIAQCDTQAELNSIVSQFAAQTVRDKTLLLLTNLPLDEEMAGVSLSNVATYPDVESLLSALKAGEYHYTAIFNRVNFYGQHYLEDLLYSYRYLQYHQSPPATKASYYSFSQGELISPKGREYHFVDNHYTTRTLYPMLHFLKLLGQYPLEVLIAGRSILERAFSTDCFSYIQNGVMLDKAEKEWVCGDLIVDAGISLENHLLPIAEAIQFKQYEAPESIAVKVDQRLVKETLCPEIKMHQDRHAFHFESSLTSQEHRLIILTDALVVDGWNRLKVYSKIESEGDVLLVVEFLDKTGKQISHATLAPHHQITLECPEDAFYTRFNLRIKGKANVALTKEIQLELQNIVGLIEHETYESDDIVLFTHDEIDQLLVRPKSQQIKIQNQKEGLLLHSTMETEKHAYLYFSKIFTRAEVNLISNSLFETIASVEGVDLRTVFIFLDKEKEKISHAILKVDNCSHAMAIPEECEFVRIGFKITGNGSALVHSLKIGELKERVNNFVGKSDTLVLAKQYPAYDDLYKYGFLHSRLRAYKKAGTIVDMFKVAWGKNNYGFREFESIDVFTGDDLDLRKALRSGQFKRLFVHILDRKMWEVLEEFVDQVEIVIWVHGAEAQLWQRRAYELDNMPAHEVERKKRLSDQRRLFWRNLLSKEHQNLKLIFVSEYFKNEFVEDICDGKENFNYQIIHNFIDSELYPYHEKKADDAYKVLSIRPFSSLTYANDLTVKAILELSHQPDFEKFQFTIVGDGPLFEETVAPLRHFKNVTLRKEFLTQAEIADLHREHGIFLVPTRMDTQGVSRGEAMSSGLVAVTTDVAAVSEFVSNKEGVLVPSEDYNALADKILWLSENPNVFTKLSINGRARVLEQCSEAQTIYKELSILEGR